VDAFAQRINLYSNDDGLKHRYWGDDMDYGLIEDFVAAVKERRAATVTGEDGLRALEVALAAYESAKSHLPVRIG
jgi:UDP-N-acetylglucosamine 3-dehydrogenase